MTPRWTRWTALAAAAVVATLLLVRSDELPPGPSIVSPLEAATPPTVESASEDVAVIETDNPDITVVWFIRGEN